jgi:glycosyltransferase involved in cell wall biosynthesis
MSSAAAAVTGVAIGIPARDEADRIEESLRSVVEAAARVPVPVSIVVVADACTDATATIAGRVLATAPPSTRSEVVECDARSAGVARQLAVATALECLDAPADPDRIWLATTDADTRVPRDWLIRQLAWAAGLVRLDPRDALPAPVRATFDAMVSAEGFGHPHIHGANLGVRAGCWLRAGGFPPLGVGEDRALWARLRALGAHLVGVTDTVVVTSGRTCGRTGAGFARYLCELHAPVRA